LLIVLAAGPSVVLGADTFPVVENATVIHHCGDCHIAYQPQMLPQRSWRKLMKGLLDHFGEKIRPDDEVMHEVLQYHLQNAADARKAKKRSKYLKGLGPRDAPIRITETPRWLDEHEDLPEDFWSDPRIEFKGRCETCHTEAESGLYGDEDGLRVPGPDETWEAWDD
jgi:hypothetical protein